MINQVTLDKLHGMCLSAMAEAFTSQTGDKAYASLTFEERFGMIIDQEWGKRRSNKLQKLIRTAGFRYPNACMESIEYHEDRKLNKSQLLQFSTCRYIQEGHHLIIEGPSGNGKTFLACALGNAACRNFMTVRYVRLPELLNDLVVARGEGTYKKLIKIFQKVDLLILDEWLLKPLTTDQAMDLFEIIEARTRQGAMIFNTQFDPRGWYDRIGTPEDGTVSEAIIDRVKHNAYEILINGKISMRERPGLNANKPGGANE
ncbi:Mobile element protein [Desulfosporosinus sp. I2]|uniref:ATP-binding protein n=1 Tax=Desulfosporosinus sp. I2 TaxID=1617025 RepID=UPI0005EFCBB3|nr:ATP-binding protein [Desulfosporosinus sp. I2]KJR46367.1 Mobile element protein [Desulfosporosinus sp. I2]